MYSMQMEKGDKFLIFDLEKLGWFKYKHVAASDEYLRYQTQNESYMYYIISAGHANIIITECKQSVGIAHTQTH